MGFSCRGMGLTDSDISCFCHIKPPSLWALDEIDGCVSTVY